eukprot:TRINITY_DN3560_c0_g1_i4.p1 TRINITY_DN3560_c0_g1~~TRINITY_DN3560_c0_g1_i4.p1  ORF type:complete len:698 (+),score=298.05 TRINITY_DN3560_c0_g1_i4:240-2333(+)
MPGALEDGSLSIMDEVASIEVHSLRGSPVSSKHKAISSDDVDDIEVHETSEVIGEFDLNEASVESVEEVIQINDLKKSPSMTESSDGRVLMHTFSQSLMSGGISQHFDLDEELMIDGETLDVQEVSEEEESCTSSDEMGQQKSELIEEKTEEIQKFDDIVLNLEGFDLIESAFELHDIEGKTTELKKETKPEDTLSSFDKIEDALLPLSNNDVVLIPQNENQNETEADSLAGSDDDDDLNQSGVFADIGAERPTTAIRHDSEDESNVDVDATEESHNTEILTIPDNEKFSLDGFDMIEDSEQKEEKEKQYSLTGFDIVEVAALPEISILDAPNSIDSLNSIDDDLSLVHGEFDHPLEEPIPMMDVFSLDMGISQEHGVFEDDGFEDEEDSLDKGSLSADADMSDFNTNAPLPSPFPTSEAPEQTDDLYDFEDTPEFPINISSSTLPTNSLPVNPTHEQIDALEATQEKMEPPPFEFDENEDTRVAKDWSKDIIDYGNALGKFVEGKKENSLSVLGYIEDCKHNGEELFERPLLPLRTFVNLERHLQTEGDSNEDEVVQIHHKLLFDCVNERLNEKVETYLGSNIPKWSRRTQKVSSLFAESWAPIKPEELGKFLNSFPKAEDGDMKATNKEFVRQAMRFDLKNFEAQKQDMLKSYEDELLSVLSKLKTLSVPNMYVSFTLPLYTFSLWDKNQHTRID